MILVSFYHTVEKTQTNEKMMLSANQTNALPSSVELLNINRTVTRIEVY